MSTPTECLDCCIVSTPLPSPNSMRLSVNVTMGNSLILRQVGTYNQIYHNDQTTDMFVEIAANGNYSIPQGTQVFFMATDAPVTVTAALAGIDYSFPVNSLLILDSAYDSIMVSNPSTTNAVAVHMSYVSTT